MAQNDTNHDKHVNVYELVTKQILQQMMRGEIPWRKTWTASKGAKHPFTNHFTGRPYSFINTLLLGTPGEYATWNQIEDAGGHVVKGAKSKVVIYWGEYVPKDRKEEAKRLEEEGKDISHLKVRFPKYFRVFDIKDTEGVKEKPVQPEPEMQKSQAPTDIADMAIDDYTRNFGVTVEEQDVDPFYDALSDTVVTPSRKAFSFEEDFYASLFAQLVHSTAADGRCGRKKEMELLRECDASVKEELIAEIGSSMCLSVAGIDRKETSTQQAAVCQKWIEAMQNDYRLIVQASYGAEKAAKMILGDFAA